MFGGRGRRHHGGYHRRHNMALFMLFMQMAKVGFDRIPPVTLCTILGQVAIFLKLFPVPPIGKICISAVNVWYKEDWWRLFSAAFFHLDEWHLYYNMISFLWKGITLEKRYGSFYMAFLIAAFAVLCNATTVALSIGAEALTDDPSYLSACAAGFSGVIFALKVVTTHLTPPGTAYVMGFFPVPSRYACWVELLAIQFIVPNASFVGHLAGILVGLAYIKGPLKMGVDTVAGFISSLFHPPASAFGGANRFSGGGRSTGTRSANGTTPRSHQQASAAQAEDEELQEAIRRSLAERYDQPRSTPSAPPPPSAPSAPRSSLYPDLSSESPSSSPGYHSHPESPTLPPRYQERPETTAPYPTNSPNHPMPGASPYPDHPPPPYPGNTDSGSGSGINQDELRRRRLEKFRT